MLDATPSWVAVMTFPQAETSVARHFATDPSPIEYYLPMLMAKDRRYRKNSMQPKPMFPCYLFARINNKQIYQTRTTHGVMQIVSIDHNIVRVPQKDIDAIRTFEASMQKVYVMETAQLLRGAAVKVVGGPFEGMQGVMLKGCKEGNFCVSIAVMNKSFVVRLKRDELMPIASPMA